MVAHNMVFTGVSNHGYIHDVARRKNPPDYLRTLGARIRKAREDRGTSRSDFAYRIRVSMTSLAQIERGENEPSLPTLIRIAAELSASIDELAQGLPLPDE
jgi:DNA-binding XRE family transcriptional regulator